MTNTERPNSVILSGSLEEKHSASQTIQLKEKCIVDYKCLLTNIMYNAKVKNLDSVKQLFE